MTLPAPGDVIEGKYRVEKVLGEGGMGMVLAAHHELLDQRVAVKVLTATDEKSISRFSFEVQSTARLKSEHVARVMDVGVLPGGAPFMVMEYLEGCDLEELLKLNGHLPVQEAVGYVLQALDGLSQAHGIGIVHRDLKPANLFLAVQPSGASLIKIVDFGISKSIVSRRSGNTGALTAEHSTVGSPAYMAPEQIRASKDVDPRADLWSLGVVLYELISGKPPFAGDSVGAIFAAVLEKEAPELRARMPRVPEGVSAAVRRCMQRDPAKRYSDARGLARDLAPFGPPDSAARVARIDQTLQTAQARSGGNDARTSSVRVSVGRGRAASGDVTGDLTDTGSHEIRTPIEGAETTLAEYPSPGSPPNHRGRVAHATAGDVAFTADSPNPDALYRGLTVQSVARRARRRTGLAIAGAGAAVVVLALVAIVRANLSSQAERSPTGVSARTPPPVVSSIGSASPPAPAAPPTLAITRDPAPTAAPSPKAKPATAPHRPTNTATSPAKKHFGVLDSPD
jgi:serine/threonine-protein kinase